MNVSDLFSKVPLFEGLPPADRVALAKAATLRSYRRGERIVTQGQPGDSFFVLVKGRVAVSILSPEGREVVLSTLSAGDHFGEMALLDEAPRSADARAHERCRLLVIQKDAFDDLLFMHKDLAYEVLWSMVRMLVGRLRETNDKLTFLSTSGKF